MADADDARVEVTREDHLLVVRMVRGAKRNAVDRKMADALDAALSELDDDDALWAGILAVSEWSNRCRPCPRQDLRCTSRDTPA